VLKYITYLLEIIEAQVRHTWCP